MLTKSNRFDGVEIHGANGYLIDQFIQDNVNQRTDEYGGSIENRNRFALEVTDAVVKVIGAERTAIRLSPFSTFQGMKMRDPIPQFTDLVTKLNTRGLAYVHFVESRVAGNADCEDNSEDLKPFIDILNSPILLAGGFTAESAKKTADEQYPNKDIVVVFGRYFIANPDLVFRVQKNIKFNEYNRDTFYKAKSPEGYTDYPFSKEFQEVSA